MNTGAFGENFPYSNFHELNMDWIVKIAKDFLDQYTHIQDIIAQGITDISDTTTSGLTQLEEKKTELEGLLQAWYNEHSQDIAAQLTTAVQNLITFANSEIQRVNASIPEDYTELSNSALKWINSIGTPSSYDNKLSKVNVPVITAFTVSDGWTDAPTGVTAGTLVNFKYYTTFALQIVVSYNDNRLFIRFVNISTGATLSQWTEFQTLTNAFRLFTPVNTDYDRKLSKIATPGFFAVSSTTAWDDTPSSDFVGLVVNFVYTSATALQLAYKYKANQYYLYMRFVNPTTGAVYLQGWKQIDGTQAQNWEQVDPTTYSNSLARINHSMVTSLANAGSDWNDLPSGMITGYFSVKWYGYAYVQEFINYPDMRIYQRVCAGGNALTDWIPLSGGQNDTVYYALGDSITSGSYSNDDGEGIVATNAPWSYPNRIARKYGCVVHNLGVPGAPITQFGTQASLVQSDATLVTITGGANDYSGNIPLGTHSSSVGTSTVCGALKSAIQTIANTAPNARIVLISPMLIKRGTVNTKWSLNYTGSAGFTYAELANAMKDIADDYNLEFVDGTRQGPVNILNISSAEKDNTHPTKDFYNAIANWVGSKLF